MWLNFCKKIFLVYKISFWKFEKYKRKYRTSVIFLLRKVDGLSGHYHISGHPITGKAIYFPQYYNTGNTKMYKSVIFDRFFSCIFSKDNLSIIFTNKKLLNVLHFLLLFFQKNKIFSTLKKLYFRNKLGWTLLCFQTGEQVKGNKVSFSFMFRIYFPGVILFSLRWFLVWKEQRPAHATGSKTCVFWTCVEHCTFYNYSTKSVVFKPVKRKQDI